MWSMSALQRKISNLSFFDGVTVLLMAGISLVCAAIWRDLTEAFVGVALLTVGCIELSGRQLFHNRLPEATRWLVGSQLGLLFVIIAYCLRNIYYPPALPLDQLPPFILETLENLPGSNGNLEGMMQPLLKVVYSLFMLISVFYQGGMAMFYLRKVPLALQEPPPLPTR